MNSWDSRICGSYSQKVIRTYALKTIKKCFDGFCYIIVAYFFFRVGIMKCRVRILIVSVVVGFILKYNHYYYYYYYHPYPALNNPNPKRGV